jgi:hypothetical protein
VLALLSFVIFFAVVHFTEQERAASRR